jgi:hypothetical protein
LPGLLSPEERNALTSGPGNPDGPLLLFDIEGFDVVLELRRRKSVRYVSCGLTYIGSDTVALMRPKVPLRLASRSCRHLSRRSTTKSRRAPAIMPGKKPATTALAGYDELLGVDVTEEPRAAGVVGGGVEFCFVVVFGTIMTGVVVDVAAVEEPLADDSNEEDGEDTDLSSFLAMHQPLWHEKPLGQHATPQLSKAEWVSVLLIRLPGNVVASCCVVSQVMGAMT